MRCLIVYVRVSIFKSLYKLCEWYPFFWDMTPHNWVIFSLKLQDSLLVSSSRVKIFREFYLTLENETTSSCNVRKQLTFGIILHKEEQIHQLHQCKNLNTHNLMNFSVKIYSDNRWVKRHLGSFW